MCCCLSIIELKNARWNIEILVSISPQRPSVKNEMAAGTVAMLLTAESGSDKWFISSPNHPDKLLDTLILF